VLGTKFHGKPSSGIGADTCRQTDGRTDVTKLIISFCLSEDVSILFCYEKQPDLPSSLPVQYHYIFTLLLPDLYNALPRTQQTQSWSPVTSSAIPQTGVFLLDRNSHLNSEVSDGKPITSRRVCYRATLEPLCSSAVRILCYDISTKELRLWNIVWPTAHV